MNHIEIRKQFEKELDQMPVCYISGYGFSDVYVKWLENKVIVLTSNNYEDHSKQLEKHQHD